MRFKYYVRTLRQMELKKLFVFFAIFLILLILIIYVLNKNIEPVIKDMSESSVKSMALKVTNAAVYKNIENVKYETLVNMEKDKNGKVSSIGANVMEMNKLSNKVTSDIQEGLEKEENRYIFFPIGSFFRNSIFAGQGPKIKVKVILVGDVNAEFKSYFESAGINQVRHRIVLRLGIDLKVLAPFYVDTNEYVNEVVIAETIIVSDTPNSYYNINGVEGLSTVDSINIDK